MLSTVIVSLILSTLETSRQVAPINALSRSVTSSLEKITREVRSASSIDLPNSIFSSSSGILVINTLDANNFTKVVKYYLDSGVVKIDENDLYIGPLSSSDTNVTALIFNLATSSKQSLIKIEIDETTGSGKYQKSEKFYDSVVIREEN